MSFPKRIIALLFIVALAFPCRAAIKDDLPDPPTPPRLVNDFASAFEQSQADSLETVLVDFDERTSNQICVITVTDLYGHDVSRYALMLANKWGIGSAKNNGILVLLKTRNGDYVDITIQVGRGLEGAIPDAYASRIIRNIMGPHLRQDEYWPAVSKACVELMALAEGEISEPRDGTSEGDGDIVAAIVMVTLFLLFFLLVIIAASKDRNNHGGGSGTFRGPTITFGNGGGASHSTWSGGGFGGGSDWGGGGGFGGFGGGSFGGGGASGRF